MKKLMSIYEQIKGEEAAVYDKKKVLKFIKRYPELQKALARYKSIFPRFGKVDKSTKVIFTSYILNDPAWEREYKEME